MHFGCLITAFDYAGVRDKVLHDAIGVDKHEFSKMRAGTKAFDVALLDGLPLHVQVDFHRRALAPLGYTIRSADPEQLAAAIADYVARLEQLAAELKTTRPRVVKVEDPHA